MKKLILGLTVAVAFSYCNPSQQTNQTTVDSARMMDSTNMGTGSGTGTTGTGTGTDTGTTRTDTTGGTRTDSIRVQ